MSEQESKFLHLVCIKCGRKWQAFFPDGLESKFAECPKCHHLSGVDVSTRRKELLLDIRLQANKYIDMAKAKKLKTVNIYEFFTDIILQRESSLKSEVEKLKEEGDKLYQEYANFAFKSGERYGTALKEIERLRKVVSIVKEIEPFGLTANREKRLAEALSEWEKGKGGSV